MQKTHKKLGYSFMIIGAVLLLAALLLIVYNWYEDSKAGQAAAKVLTDIQSEIELRGGENSAGEESDEMTVVEIDGYGYIGYVSIPALNLELPVMDDWDYYRLNIAPCRHFGSVKSDSLVIAGHNYRKHFGNLSSLPIGEAVYFTDMEGVQYIYEIGQIINLSPNQVEEIRSDDWDLTLYTCTYGGGTRIAVRCKRIV